jgi:hypothetical protein
MKATSIVLFSKVVNWCSEVINKTTGYDQITEIENKVNESERRFEYTTKKLRELNIDYIVKRVFCL